VAKAGIVPGSFVMQIRINIPIDVPDFTDEEIHMVREGMPCMVPAMLTACVYKGVDHDEIKTARMLQGALASIKLPQEEDMRVGRTPGWLQTTKTPYVSLTGPGA